jgi:Domain of unknown function (DUF4214)/FG-GAP-like repeat/RTX calcium-binding nonapeptide repeat (4 copies)
MLGQQTPFASRQRDAFMVDIFETISNNETIAQAITLGAGTYNVVGLSQDWWRIDAYNPGVMTFTMTPLAAAGFNVNLELYNSAGQVIVANFDPSGPLSTESFSKISSGNEVYYLRAYDASFPAVNHLTPAYQLKVELPTEQWPQLEYEPNDTIQTAKPLTEGQYQISGRNADWYSIATNPGATSITMTPATGTDVNIELYNSIGQVIQANFASGQETLNFTADGGTYFVKVYLAANPATGSAFYRLNVDLADNNWPAPAYEPNNSLQTAVTLGEGSYKISGSGGDYFKIIGKPGQMTFDVTPAAGMDVNMELLDSSGQAIKANFSNGTGAAGKETIQFWSLTEQTYYLKIYNAAMPTGVAYYDLSIDLPTGTWAKELNFGPIREASVAVYDLDNDGKDEIIVGTSKYLDAAGNEVRPAGLIVLEDDGTVKWSLSFPGMSGPDKITGKTYSSTSVSTAPLFTDVDGDGSIDIVVGVGGDNRGDFGAVGQPGDKGGIYAVSATGQIKWYFQTKDYFGQTANGVEGPDGSPDGVYGAPQAFDIDSDGVREVIFTSWDHHLYFLDGRTGLKEREIDLHDTNSASPKLVDLNRDGIFEVITGGDITRNDAAGIPTTGGVLHVVSASGTQTVAGWDKQILTSTNADFRGFYSPQVIWSSPQTADLDGDGKLEVLYGSGNFYKDSRGDFVTVRNSDGTLRFSLPTIGRPVTAPLTADLDGDGRLEIIQTTFDGYVQAWNWQGQQLFSTKLQSYGSAAGEKFALNSPPSAIDINNDGKLELIIATGKQMAVVNYLGQQVNDPAKLEYIFQNYGGTIAVSDLDNDKRLDFISGGTNAASDRAVVYRWENPYNVVSNSPREVAYQGHQNLTNIDLFVERLYSTILKRTADAAGNNYWNDNLFAGVNSGADVARGFIFSAEFQNQNVDTTTYINTLYAAFFNRSADAGGFSVWQAQLQGGATRAAVLDGFIFSQEFANLCGTYGIRPSSSLGPDSGAGNDTLKGTTESDVLRAGAGNDFILDQGTAMPTDPAIAETYSQVYRVYAATLGREPDAGGFVSWVNALAAKNVTLIQAVRDSFVGGQEFRNTYGSLNDMQFVTLLYNNVLGRGPDAGGLQAWTNALAGGTSRADVVLGFAESGEHVARTAPKLVAYMEKIETRWNDLIEGGAGNDTMSGGIGADTYVFRAGQGGTDEIYQFEGWDVLQLSGFGYTGKAQPLAKMTQQGADVVFNDQGQKITFKNTTLAVFNNLRWNLS